MILRAGLVTWATLGGCGRLGRRNVHIKTQGQHAQSPLYKTAQLSRLIMTTELSLREIWRLSTSYNFHPFVLCPISFLQTRDYASIADTKNRKRTSRSFPLISNGKSLWALNPMNNVCASSRRVSFTVIYLQELSESDRDDWAERRADIRPKKKTFAWIASEKETMQILNWIFKKKKEGKREGERERALEKLPGADPLIPLQASRNKLVQTDCIRPSPPYLLYTLLFIYRLSKGDLMTVVNSTMHHGNFSIWTNCTYW